MESKITDFQDILEYRQKVSEQPETQFKKIALNIIDQTIEKLKKKR